MSSIYKTYPDARGSHPEYKICCPFCTDSRYRMGVNVEKKTGHCFNCGETLNRKKFYKLFGSVSQTSTKPKIEYKPNKILLDAVHLEHLISTDCSQYPELERLFHRSLRYLCSRGFEPLQVSRDYRFMLPLGDSRISNRIVLPIFESGELVSYQARALGNSKPKYLNPSKVEAPFGKSNFVYNLDVAKEFDEVIICEGIFSAISVGRNAVAVFGKELSDIQAEKIMNSGVKSVTILFDPGTSIESMRAADKLYPRIFVRIAELFSGDPNDLSNFVVEDAIMNAKKFDEFSVMC